MGVMGKWSREKGPTLFQVQGSPSVEGRPRGLLSSDTCRTIPSFARSNPAWPTSACFRAPPPGTTPTEQEDSVFSPLNGGRGRTSRQGGLAYRLHHACCQ